MNETLKDIKKKMVEDLSEKIGKELELGEKFLYEGTRIDITKHNQKQITLIRNALKKQNNKTPKNIKKATEYALYHLEEVQQAIAEKDIYRLYTNLFEGMKYQSWAHIMPTVKFTEQGERSDKNLQEIRRNNAIERKKTDDEIYKKMMDIQKRKPDLSASRIAELLTQDNKFWEKLGIKPQKKGTLRKKI